MSNSSHSLQQQQPTLESDVVVENPPSLTQETPNQPDPESTAPDPEDNPPEEEEEDEEEGEEIDEENPGMPDPPIADHHVEVPDVTLTSPSRRGVSKRKKNKKGKGKKKRQAIEAKLQTLTKKLNPIPFIPNKILDFAKHEKLLKKLGLWEFVHIDFDRTIRVDLIAQLIANYEAKSRASYVNDFRIKLNRTDLARAFKLPLPLKKEKGNVGGVEVDLDWEGLLSDDSTAFLVDFVSDWVLLHEDMWMMPDEVKDWVMLVKDGRPEKVDWAGLIWFMVEKELKQGGRLRECYYASHLQHLIKSQREEVFLVEENKKLDVEKKDEVNEENAEVGEEVSVVEGPSTKLTLGQDGEKEEESKDVEMMDAEVCKENVEEERGEWLLNGKTDLGEHFMQRCENAEEFGQFQGRKDEEEEMDGEEDGNEDDEELGNNFHDFPNQDGLEGDGFTGNLLQAMEANPIPYTSQDQLRNPSPPFFNNAGKRVIEHDNHISHHSVNDGNKRLRTIDSWDNKPVDFGMCMEQIQLMTERARMLYEEKDQAMAESSVTQQILLNEVQKRDTVIEHLHKAKLEEVQKKDGEIYRLERELYLMGSVLDGYRKALKETRKAFSDYRERAQLPEEPTYKDVGPGGLMLTAAEIEKLQKKREEDYKMGCLILEQKMKEGEAEFACQFDGYFEKINLLDAKLAGLEAYAKELMELYAKRKTAPTDEKVPEVAEPLQVPEANEEAPEVAEPLQVPEVAEPLPVPEANEEAPEVAVPLQVPEANEEAPEVAEPLQVPEANEEAPQVAEPVPIQEPERTPIQEPKEEVPEVEEPLANE